MNLIKPNVLKKFVKRFKQKDIDSAYQAFLHYQERHEAIKTFKEIEYQDGFLRHLFVDTLGHRLKTDFPDNFSLSREVTNTFDGKQADGAIWENQKIKAVIELKDMSTKDLTRPRAKGQLDAVSQAFNYKNSYKNCKYVIVSNFSEIRLYQSSKLEYVAFDLFSIDREEFGWMYSLFSLQAIEQDIPQEYFASIKKHEEEISAKFYKDLTRVRTALFQEISKQWDQERSILVEKIQKFIDRMVFIFFAEDKGLIPQNTVEQYIDNGSKWFKSKHESLLRLFVDINEGNSALNINKFNGGLFAHDDIIDNFVFSDELIDDIKMLSKYDFESDLTVNVLGHIFEQSLNDIEILKKADTFDEKNTKRKKFGIFYTPEHITRYICEETIGAVCAKKRKALEIDFIDTEVAPKKRLNKKEKTILEKLYEYKKFLENLKIIDPACGSGAFLNMAFEVLKKEYEYFDEMRRFFEGDALGLYDVDIKILENNLYGVDINQESVDIAKLSLWLKTATTHRQLSNLSSKIRQGDSLAIDFGKYFPEVKEKGGFDVVIGNPPYVRYTSLDDATIDYLCKKYDTAYKQFDLYVPFNEQAVRITRPNGYISFIQPNKFLGADYGIKLLQYLRNNVQIVSIKNVAHENIFADASTYPYIFIYKKNSPCLLKENNSTQPLNIFKDFKDISFIKFNIDIKLIRRIIKKIDDKSIKVGDTYRVKRGVPASKFSYEENGIYHAIKSTDLDKPYKNDAPLHNISYKEPAYGKEKDSEFIGEKILMPRTVKNIRAAIDNNHHVLDRIYYLIPKDKKTEMNIYMHLGVLNSSLMNIYYLFHYMTTTIGGGYFDLKGTQIKNFFLPKDSISKINNLVSVFIESNNDNYTNLQSNIDKILMQYYGLSQEESRYVLEGI